MVESLDRISRQNAYDALPIFQLIANSGITIVTLVDSQEYSAEALRADPLKLMLAFMVMIRANEESAMKSSRVRAAWGNKRKHAADQPMTKRCPAWLELDDDKIWHVQQDRAEVVRKIFRWYLSGIGQNAIAKRLNESSTPVFGRGRQWHRSYIAKLLSNQSVIGTIIPHTLEHTNGQRRRVAQEPIENYYPPIIGRETWDAVQAMRTNVAKHGSHQRPSIRNVFAGLAKCPECGSAMTRVSKGNRKKAGRPYLVCTRAKEGAGCKYRAVQYEPLEIAIREDIERILGEMPINDGGVELEGLIVAHEEAIDAKREEIDEIVNAIGAGRRSATLRHRLDVLEDDLDSLQKELDSTRRRRDSLSKELVGLRANRLKSELSRNSLDRPAINAILKQLMEKVVVDYEWGRLEFHWAHSGATDIQFDWASVWGDGPFI